VAGSAKYYRNDFSRVFLIKQRAGPSNPPSYQGLWRAGALSWNQGDVTLVRVPSFSEYGAFDTVGKILGQPGNPELPITARYTNDLSELLKMAAAGCDHDLQIHMGSCRNPQDFNGGWDKIVVLEGAHITSYGTGDLGALDPSERAVVNEEVPFAGEDAYEIKPMNFASKAGGDITQEVVSVSICDSKTCGLCGLPSDGCQVIFALTKSTGASPGLVAELIYSDDGGSTWNQTNIDTLSATEDPTAVICVGQYVLVVSRTTLTINYAPIVDVLEGTETWSEVTTGFVVGGEPIAVWSASPGDTWFVGAGGYIYKSAAPTDGVEVQDAGVATTQPLNDIDGVDTLNVIAVGNNNAVVYTDNGGDTWTTVTGPAPGINLTSVQMISALRWIVGAANGRLYYTETSGSTWREKSFPSAGTGSVTALAFVNQTVGYMAHTTAGGAGRILRTIDGGFSWYVLPEGTSSIPTNQRINALATCPDVNKIWGAGLGVGTDGILVLGA
jgi:photosystem II stability/assembly factor-like uncharacterized protein